MMAPNIDLTISEFLLQEADFAKFLHFSHLYNSTTSINRFAQLIAAEVHCRNAGFEPSERDVTTEVNVIRMERTLLKSGKADTWLAEVGLTVADLEWFARLLLCERKVIETKVEPNIEKRFAFKRAMLDEAELYRIIVGTDAEAVNVHRKLVAKEDFLSVARVSSIETSEAKKGGYIGWVRRGDLNAAVHSTVFATDEPRITEPIRVGSLLHIYKIEQVKRAALTGATYADLQRELFGEWFEEFLQTYSRCENSATA